MATNQPFRDYDISDLVSLTGSSFEAAIFRKELEDESESSPLAAGVPAVEPLAPNTFRLHWPGQTFASVEADVPRLDALVAAHRGGQLVPLSAVPRKRRYAQRFDDVSANGGAVHLLGLGNGDETSPGVFGAPLFLEGGEYNITATARCRFPETEPAGTQGLLLLEIDNETGELDGSGLSMIAQGAFKLGTGEGRNQQVCLHIPSFRIRDGDPLGIRLRVRRDGPGTAQAIVAQCRLSLQKASL